MSETLWRVLDGLPDPAVLVDSRGLAVRVSRSFAPRLRLRAREVSSQLEHRPTFVALLEGLGLTLGGRAGLEIIACLAAGRPAQLAEVGASLNGEDLVLWMGFTPVDVAGGVTLVSLRDVSSEARVQVRYRRLLEAANARADSLERAVEERTRELRAALDEVSRLARSDSLTGLNNRRAFTDIVETKLNAARRHQRPMAIALLDLDHFKRVNDTFGHAAGDSILRAAAQAFVATIRASDVVGRLGGEEFAVAFDETGAQDALQAAERLRGAVEAISIASIMPGRAHPQTVSIGVAVFPEDGDSLDGLLHAADKALYRAKSEGRNRVLRGSSTSPRVSSVAPRVRVLVAGFEPSLATLEGYDVVQIRSWDEAAAVVESQRFDAIVVDYGAGRTESLAFLDGSLRTHPGAIRLVSVASFDEFAFLEEAGLVGVDGFVLRHEAAVQLAEAVADIGERRARLRESLHAVEVAQSLGQREQLERELSRAIEGAIDVRFEVVTDATGVVVAQRALPAFDGVRCPEAVWRVAQRRGLVPELVRPMRAKLRAWMDAHPDVSVLIAAEMLGAPGSEPSGLDALRTVALLDAAREVTRRLRDTIDWCRHRGYRVALAGRGAGFGALCAAEVLRPDLIYSSETSVWEPRTPQTILPAVGSQSVLPPAERRR